MKKLLFIIANFFAGITLVSAGGGGMAGMSQYPGDYFAMIYSSDGLSILSVTCATSECTYSINGIKKGVYTYIDYPQSVGNDFFMTATDASGKRYLIKNSEVIASGEVVNLIMNYSQATPQNQFLGWSVYNDGTYSLWKKDGSLILEVKNVSVSSNTYYLGEDIFQTTISDKNNINQAVYINDKKITPGTGYVQVYGLSKRNRKNPELLLSISDPMGIQMLSWYNPQSGQSKKLPSYDGVTQVVPIIKKDGTIKDFQYIATIDGKFVFVDMNGNILSKEPYDSVTNFMAYGEIYLKTFTRNEKSYLFFDKKLYGPYDAIDTFNPSFGMPGYAVQYSQVIRWSVFVKTQGKNAILANGKLFFID